MNRFASSNADEQAIELLAVPEEVRSRQLARLSETKASRDEARVQAALAGVTAAAASAANAMPVILEAVRSYATVGEISEALAAVFGRHRASTVV